MKNQPAEHFGTAMNFLGLMFKSLSIVEHVELNTECESIGSG